MTEKTSGQVDIFSLEEIPITVSYTEMGAEPITFYLRPFLVRDEQKARAAFFALTDDEQEKEQASHNVRMVSALSVRAPEGVPGFAATGNPAADIQTFFGDGNPMKEKVLADVMTRYSRKTQPAEFFRSV
jgi:hypothetical protein